MDQRQPPGTTKEVAPYLRMRPDALSHIGKAPKATKVGNKLLWKWSDVDAWLEANASTTSAHDAGRVRTALATTLGIAAVIAYAIYMVVPGPRNWAQIAAIAVAPIATLVGLTALVAVVGDRVRTWWRVRRERAERDREQAEVEQ